MMQRMFRKEWRELQAGKEAGRAAGTRCSQAAIPEALRTAGCIQILVVFRSESVHGQGLGSDGDGSGRAVTSVSAWKVIRARLLRCQSQE